MFQAFTNLNTAAVCGPVSHEIGAGPGLQAGETEQVYSTRRWKEISQVRNKSNPDFLRDL